MAGFDYSTEAELFPLVRLRRKFTKGGLVGYKQFTSAAEAIRFAVEQLPPDLLAVPILKSPRRGSMRAEFVNCTTATHIR